MQLCGQNVELLNVKHYIHIECMLQTVTSSVMPPCAARRILPSVRVSTASILRSHHLALRCDPITGTASALPGFRPVAGLEAVQICSECEWAGWLAGWM